jgi:hypothetical protein
MSSRNGISNLRNGMDGILHVEQRTLCLSAYPGSRRVYPNFPDLVDNEIYAYNNKHSLRSNKKGYGGKTH